MTQNSNTTKDALIDAGLNAMTRRGFNGVGLNDIVKAADVPKGSFYYYFESKDAFGAAAVRSYGEAGAAKRREILTEDAPPISRLRRYFDMLRVDFSELEHTEGCFLGAMGSEMADQSEAVRKALKEQFNGWRSSFVSILNEAKAAGDIGEEVSVEPLADYIIHAWEGALIRMKIEKSSKPLDDFIETTFEQILKG